VGRALRPWRGLSAAIALVETAGISVAMFFAFVGSSLWAYVAAGALVGLELVKWLVEEAGRRKIPDFDFARLYASAPLTQQQRRLVGFELALTPIMAAAFVTLAVSDPRTGAAVVFIVLVASQPSLYRVWRHNSWLAISRLPMRPRNRVT
jgi:hypothetical protein